MKRLDLKGVAVVAASCFFLALVPRLARSADHLDSPEVKKDPTADINDLYTFMDGNRVVFALTVFPAAPVGSKFSDAVQYVVHTATAPAFGQTESAEKNIICTFDPTQKISCFVGNDDAVDGDASNPAGITSASGKLRVFAGRRADPFFFSLDSFNKTVATIKGAAGGLNFDSEGCPAIDSATSSVLVNMLKTHPNGGPATDFFEDLNALAIVISVDKSLLTAGTNHLLSAWAGTHKKP